MAELVGYRLPHPGHESVRLVHAEDAGQLNAVSIQNLLCLILLESNHLISSHMRL